MHLSKQGRRVVYAQLIKFGKDQPGMEQSDLQFWPMQEAVGLLLHYSPHSHKPFSQIPAASSSRFQVIKMLKNGTRKNK